FPAWLAARLDALGLDRAVYGAYIEGLLREEESDEERLEALRAVLAACLEEDLLNDVCREVVERWSDSQVVDAKEEREDEVQAITSMMEKQARIVVKPREVSQEEKQRKAALLAQYANVTDEEEYPFPALLRAQACVGQQLPPSSAGALSALSPPPALFRNTNVEDVLNARKLERELLRDEFQKKKEQDKLQREKDKLAKQERKEKEKKRTQKGERKR
ncbi:CCD43 protein, partial [Leiothrix lutea]|nr:CCD43 protein [Leiothrix lutea]